MQPEAQRIAIAQACGWTQIARVNRGEYGGLRGVAPDGLGKIIPSYCRDLNAMHEAFKSMDEWTNVAFVRNLVECHRRRSGRSYDGAAAVAMLHASAEDWAEAFLRTLNLWTESQ